MERTTCSYFGCSQPCEGFSVILKECGVVDLFTNKNDDLFMECKQNILCRLIKIIRGIVQQDAATADEIFCTYLPTKYSFVEVETLPKETNL